MSKEFTCVIVDDEPAAVRLLEKYVAKIPHLELKASFTKPLEALAFIETQGADLLLLDVQMPEITGIQLSRILHNKTRIIFTTAYPEFALESYDVAAVDYLLKPIEFERFYKSIQKLDKGNAAVPAQEVPSKDIFFFKTDGKNKFKKVVLEDIRFIEGLKNYVSVQLKEEQIITYNTLKHLREGLPDSQFIQIHKSFIIAVTHIDRIENDAVWMGTHQLPIGNTYRKAFFEAIAKRQL